MKRRYLAVIVTMITTAAFGGQMAPAFQIVSEDGDAAARRLAVRAGQRLSEPDLKAMAETIKARQPAGTVIEVIRVYLPDMKLTQNAWAEVHPAGGGKVVINGLRADEIEAYRAEAAGDTRAVIGVWLTAPPAMPGRLTIWRDKSGKVSAEWRLRNGEKSVDELIESKVSNGRRFDIVGAGGGYYLATHGGDLELGQKSNVIAVAERLTFEKAPVKAEPIKNSKTGATAVLAAEPPKPHGTEAVPAHIVKKSPAPKADPAAKAEKINTRRGAKSARPSIEANADVTPAAAMAR